MSSFDFKEKQVLFPNATPFSLDNYKPSAKGKTKEGLTVDNDASLDSAMAALMTEYAKDVKDTKDANGAKDAKKEGMLTGTSMNLNLLQGDLVNYGRYDLDKNPIQPFTDMLHKMDEKAGVFSYKEGLTNDTTNASAASTSTNTVSTTTTGTTSAGKSQKLIDLEKKLSDLINEYTTQYRLYTDDLLVRSRFLQTNSQYLNKIVRDISYSGPDASAAFYYVNSFGYTHRLKDISSVMMYDNKTCPTITRNDALPSDDAFNPFKLTAASFIDISGGSGSGSAGAGAGGGFSRFADYSSYDMVGNTPCITSRNVKLTASTADNDEYAWVDTEGKKHVYEKGVWPDKRHSSCLTSVVGEPIILNANQYNAIPTSTNTPTMKEDSECFRASVSSTVNSKMVEIKKHIENTVAEIKKENQNILNSVANTTIIQRQKTAAEKLAEVDDNLLAQIKGFLGGYYYPAVYAFWCFMILIAVLIIFKFAFMFVSPGGGGDNGNMAEGNGNGGGVSLLGVVIMALIVIFAVYYYFSYTYNLDIGVTRTSPDSYYTTV